MHRLRLPLIIAAAALAAWWWLPGSDIERGALELGVRGSANPPFFIEAVGGRAGGWKLRTVNAKPRVDPAMMPTLVSLGDDPDGVFQSSPPSPLDLAVILKNFQRLGAKRAACATVLAWDAPDPISLAALDREMAAFERLAMAAPLGRGPLAEPMPPAFRRASISAAEIRGDASRIPMVNRVAIRDLILGADNTVAGFQWLESDRATRHIPLLARWDDRVVFAFPMIAAMERLGLEVAKIEIRLGQYLRLAPDGPVVPIDESGHLAIPPAAGAKPAAIPAADLIDAPDDLLDNESPRFPVLIDERAGTERVTREFTSYLPSLMAVIVGDAGLAEARSIRRLGGSAGLACLAVFCLLLCLACRLPAFSRLLAFMGLAALVTIAQTSAVSYGWWLPGLPALAALAVALVICQIPPLRRCLVVR